MASIASRSIRRSKLCGRPEAICTRNIERLHAVVWPSTSRNVDSHDLKNVPPSCMALLSRSSHPKEYRSMTTSTARTAVQELPLHALHLSNGGRMVHFAGYDMPIQYAAGILK